MGRLSNYELARIIAMLMIVYFHFSINTKWGINEHPKDKDGKELKYVMTTRHFVIFIGESVGKTGVQLFMIMSGYFLGSKPSSLSTILRTWFRVVSWCWIIPFGFHVAVDRKMSWDDWNRAIFPVLTCHFWFVSTYLFTMVISPMLSKIVRSLTVKEYAGVLGTMFFGQSMTLYWKQTHRLKEYCYSPWLWFIFLYLVGAFIKQHPKHIPQWRAWTYALTLNCLFFIDVATVGYFRSHPNIQWVKDNYGPMTLVRADNSILSFFMALNIFILCGKIPFESKTINWLAKMTFSVYLIHDHYMMRPYIWTKWLKAQDYKDSNHFYLIYIGAPAMVYMCCTLLEAVRQKLFARIETYVCNALGDFISGLGGMVSRILGLEDSEDDYDLPLAANKTY